MLSIGYVRVSTAEQASEGISLDMQEHKIFQYCSLHNLETPRIIQDVGSGRKLKTRAGVLEILNLVKSGQVGHVVVYKLDRLARNTQECLEIAETLKKYGVSLHSITEKIDTNSAIGEFFFTLLASLAQMESKLIGERTSAAMQRNKENGKKYCRHVPYGCDVTETRELIENEYEQGVITQIRDLHGQGLTARQIVTALKQKGLKPRTGIEFSWTTIKNLCEGAE